MRYRELVESFDAQPLKWFRKAPDGWFPSDIDGGHSQKMAQIIVGSEQVRVFFTPRFGDDGWGLHFMSAPVSKPKSETTMNTGRMGSSSLKVFGGVVTAIEQFIQTIRPNLVTFSGSKHQGKGDIYMKIAKALSSRLGSIGYRVGQNSDDEESSFDEFFIKPALNEAPMADVSTTGDPWEDKPFDQGTSFGDVDRKIITSPKGVQKIVRAFQNTPFTFKVIFINHQVTANTDSENNMVDSNAAHFKAGIYKEWGDIIGEPGVIKVALLSNLSPVENKVPITGWMLAHKIGHSIQDHIGANTTKKTGTSYSKISYEIIRLINDIYMEETDHRYPHQVNKGRWHFGDIHYNASEILTMKSAREHKLDNTFEFFAEVVAQYLVKGRVEMRIIKPKSTEMLTELNDYMFKLFKLLEGHVLLEV